MIQKLVERTRAFLIGTVMEIGVGVLLASVIIGKVALPTFFAVSTAGWDSYTILVWGILPLVVAVSLLVAIYNRAKYAYTQGLPY